MSTAAITGVGAQFKRGDGASNEAFTAIAEINSIGLPEISRDMIEATDLDSTGGYREWISGFRDSGSCALELNFTRDGWETFKTDLDNDDEWNYQIVFPDTGSTTFDFAALCSRIGGAIPMDDKISLSIEVKLTGDITMSS